MTPEHKRLEEARERQRILKQQLVEAGINPETMYAPGLSHKKLIEGDRPEKRRMLAILRKVFKKGYSNVIIQVDHEGDNSCCLTEPFEKTQSRLVFEMTDKITR